MKKKVTFLTFEGHNRPSARIRCYNFAKTLKQRGFETEVVSFVDTLGVDENDIYDLTDTEKIYLNYKALPKLLKDKDQIIYIQKIYYHTFSGFFVGKLTGVKLIIDYDDYDFNTPIFRNKHLARFINPLYLTKKVLNQASAVVAASRYLKKHLEDISNNGLPIHLIPTGVDTEKFKIDKKISNADNEKIVFSWAGLIWGEPIIENIIFIIESFSMMRMKDTARLEIAGNYFHLKHKLEKLIKEKYSHLDIKLKDWISPEDMPDYLSTVHVGLLPLLQDNDYNRSKSPTKLFEYMALGIPVIASRRGEAEFVIEDKVNGFLADTPEETARKMDVLAKDHDLRMNMGKAGKTTIEKEYALNVLGDKLAGILERI